jgi:Protein of unknown function (DUF4236)
MPLRFQRRITIVRGISLNLNKRSISASIGGRGAHFTVGPKGQRSTIGLPGTGLSHTSYWRTQLGTAAIVLIVAIILLGLIFRLA